MQYIKRENLDAVALVTVSRPDALNALSSAVLEELWQVFSQISAEEAVRAVVLTGEGKAFVAGADVAEMRAFGPREALDYAARGNAIFTAIEDLPQPVIAAVNGYALGGGCELALACDFRIASERARFGQPEAGLGITPGFGGTQRLTRTVGAGAALQMLLTAKPIDAQEALRMGLVNAVHSQESMMAEAMSVAQSIAGNAPFAVRGIKAAVRGATRRHLASDIAGESEWFARCFQTEDQKEAMAAFVEKRKAAPFQGK